MKISVIIPSYYSSPRIISITKECLKTLFTYSKPDEVIVVDDGSPLPSKWLTGGVKWVRRDSNGGFAAAVNTGLKKAKGDILIIANNDIKFLPGWMEALTKPLNMGYDISSIRTTDCDGWDTEDKITKNDKFGSLWAMRRKVYDELGGLDTRFGKGTFEDLDYRRRAMESGMSIAKNHNGLVEHIGRATFDEVDPQKTWFLHNREVYKDKWDIID